MKILVVGGGGREHAIAWKLHQSPQVENIYCAPGNPGIAAVAECVPIGVGEIEKLVAFAREKHIDVTVPGPEAPLVDGIVDAFNAAGLAVFGPTQAASRLEGSKSFSKDFMKKYNIPTAAYQVFTEFEEAIKYAKSIKYPSVVKADGLAAGKGAIIVEHFSEAEAALKKCMVDREFGDAGKRVVIEEFLTGEEASIFALCDGENYIVLAPAQDHKAIFDGDKGPNTGGMGTYAPAPIVTDSMMQKVKAEVIEPTLKGMAAEGCPYTGVIFIGLMIENGEAKVLEYNCRFGDPEAQVILPLLDGDLAEIVHKGAHKQLYKISVKNKNQYAVCVVLASGGYPGNYEKGKIITGINGPFTHDITVFHSGTKLLENGDLVTAGGRVLSVVAQHADYKTCRKQAYEAIEKIQFDGAYHRTDIGAKALKFLE